MSSPTDTSSAEPRVVLVTGASSGIGRAVAVQAAERGDHVVLAARGAAALAQAAAECTSAGATSVTVLPTDVADDEEVQACVEQTLAEHGRLDVVVHSAGVVSYGRIEEVPAEVAEQVVRTDLLGSLNVARHVVPVLRRQHEGTLVLLGSVIGHLGVPTMTPYVLSKWGVRALAHQLRLENRDRPGVQIRYVAPGGVDTPIYTQAANYAGFVGRPPPPVSSARRAAAQIWRRVDHGWLPDQLSALNYPMAWGRAYLPWLYDRLVGPLFPVGATDLTRPVPPTDGNVMAPRTDGETTEAGAAGSLVGIARNLAVRLRGA